MNTTDNSMSEAVVKDSLTPPASVSAKQTLGRFDIDSQTRNVQLIMRGGYRLVGRMPAEVRKELRAAVKTGVLGHIKKDGLLPEAFFWNIHPHCYSVLDARKREALCSVKCIASVMVSPAEFRAGVEAMGGDVEQELLARAKATESAS